MELTNNSLTVFVFFILWVVSLLSSSMLCVLLWRHYAHMFQLNSYHAAPQLKWLLKSKDILGTYAMFTSLIPTALYVWLLSASRENAEDWLIRLCVAAAVIVIYNVCMTVSALRKPPAKKPLVFTPRVTRMAVTSVILYLLYIFLIRFQPWFMPAPLPTFLSVSPILAFLILPLSNLANTPLERSINRKYIGEAKEIMQNWGGTTVGITGSFGKTSVKYFLTKLFEMKYNTVMTPESFNTTLGVVKTVRGEIKNTTEIFVCEMGAKGVGEIKEICDIVHPKHSVITSVGKQHLESFGSVENIIKTKFEIADAVTDGYIFLNYNNEYIRANAEKYKDKKIVAYGTENADYTATDISVSDKGSQFTLTMPNGEKVILQTSLIGSHNIENITGACAVAHTLGVEVPEIVFGVKKLAPVPHRLELRASPQGDIIIDDAFNSNPAGARAALDTLYLLDGVRFLVTPGMIELGKAEAAENEALGAYAAGKCDAAVLVGEKRAVPIKKGLLSAGFPEDRVKICRTIQDALKFVYEYDVSAFENKRRVILLENDLPDNY